MPARRPPISAEDMVAEVERLRALRNAPPPTLTSSARRFDAAIVDRLTASWMTSVQSLDADLRGSLDTMRARSRDLFRNNEYAAKFGRMVRNNIVGPEGFILQARVTDPSGAPDSLANRAIESAWWRWMRASNCDLAGRVGFVQMVRNLITTTARDGEYLVRVITGRGRGEFGLQLQPLDPARLDTTFNRSATAGSNAIVMGVELDAYRRPVAYHLRTGTDPQSIRIDRERVPAAQILHGFVPAEDEQTRGVPWMHAAMRRLKDLDGYREAAVIAARLGASKMGFYTAPNGEPPAADDTDAAGNFVQQAHPGEFGILPPGYDFKSFDPTYPHDQFDAFTKATLRGVASGWGVSYHGLGNDLEGVTYSSIRAGVLEEREEWMALQHWFIDAFLVPVFEAWLEWALLLGAIRLPSGAPLPAAKLDKFLAHVWIGRRWGWVDPLKDINASILAIQNGLASPQQVVAAAGRDVEDILDDIASFTALAKSKGVELASATRHIADPGPD